jgi:hypothetical protein
MWFFNRAGVQLKRDWIFWKRVPTNKYIHLKGRVDKLRIHGSKGLSDSAVGWQSNRDYKLKPVVI